MIDGMKEELTLFKETDAFAAYSMPHSSNHSLISGSISNHPSPKGSFIVQKFDKENSAPLFIEANLVLQNEPFQFEFSDEASFHGTDKEDYIKIVDQTIRAIERGEFRKVVISKIKTISIGKNFSRENFFLLFDRLKKMYPKAFVFLYHIPEKGCWCGATPEVLLDASSTTFTTMALAGTQVDHGVPLDEVVWGHKEIEEQRIIEEYVEFVLAQNDLKFEKIGPETMRAGNVLHILSSFKIPYNDDPIGLADSLHPGPAICGTPAHASLQWIKDIEEHDREDYCGYIGPWKISGESVLFINLRSMRIYANQFILFLGGGITALSDPQAEWNETELKAQTLLLAIEQNASNG